MNEDVVNTETVGAADVVPVENATHGLPDAGAAAVPVEAGAVADAAVEHTQDTESAEPVVNPFDFSEQPEGEAEDSGGGAEEAAVDAEGEYVLDFGEAFGGTDEVRAMITARAKESGISAEAGSRFIAGVCEQLRADALRQAQEGYKALEDEWKGDFGVRMQRCKGVLHGLLKEGVVKQEDMAGLMNQAVFRIVDSLGARLGERGAVGTREAAAVSARTKYDEIMGNPKSAEFQILMNPSHPKYRETADYVNRLAGSRVF